MIVDELIAVLGYRMTGEDAARRFQSTMDRLQGRAAAFAAALTRFGIAAGTALGVASIALGKSVISTSAQFESFGATLETIEGSQEKAQASLAWIEKFASKTPYDLAGVTEAFVKLKAYGIDPIANDTIRKLGDTASAMGKPLMQAVEAFADAATGEFERLKEFGIKAETKGDQVTFAWDKNGKRMTKTVKKNSEEIRKFLLDNFGQRFSGAMDKQSRTWNGMMSNLGDAWTNFQRRIGSAGFFDNMKRRLEGLLATIDRLDKSGKLDRWAKGISNALTSVMDVVGAVAGRFATNLEFLADHWERLEGPVKGVGLALLWIVARAFPVISALAAVGLAIDDLLSYLQGGQSVIGDFIAKIQELTGVSKETATAIGGIGAAIGAALLAGIVLHPIAALKALGAGLIIALRGVLTGAALAILTGLPAVLAILTKGVGILLAKAALLLSNPIGWGVLIAAAVAALAYYFRDELLALGEKVVSYLTGFWDRIKSWFANNPWIQLLSGVAAKIFGRLGEEMDQAWEGVKAKTQQLFEQLKAWILSFDWVQVGISIMNSIWEGMKSIGDQIREWFSSLLPDWARGLLKSGEVAEPAKPTVEVAEPEAPAPEPSAPDAPTPGQQSTPPQKPSPATPTPTEQKPIPPQPSPSQPAPTAAGPSGQPAAPVAPKAPEAPAAPKAPAAPAAPKAPEAPAAPEAPRPKQGKGRAALPYPPPAKPQASAPEAPAAPPKPEEVKSLVQILVEKLKPIKPPAEPPPTPKQVLPGPQTPSAPSATGGQPSPQPAPARAPEGIGSAADIKFELDAIDAKLELQRENLQQAIGNLSSHLQNMVPETATSATVTDARQDNRQFPMTVNTTVNQTVTQATAAPAQAASATGSAVSKAVAGQRSQIETGPAF